MPREEFIRGQAILEVDRVRLEINNDPTFSTEIPFTSANQGILGYHRKIGRIERRQFLKHRRE